MSNIPITISRSVDGEEVFIYSDDYLLAHANHDEHGWAGIALLEDAVVEIAQRYDISIVNAS